MFAVTPGGFVQVPFPQDFRALVRHARDAVDEVLTPEVLDAATGRAEFTLGVDLNDRSGKRKMDGKARGTHAELVAIVDVERGEPVQWTGTSYPVAGKNSRPGSGLELAPVSLR